MNAQLTAYALACGGVQSKTVGKYRVQLYREHTCYHVRAHAEGRPNVVWWSYDNLRAARVGYRNLSDAATIERIGKGQ